jgi:Zn finger protein HypA/HybF involved in hydrogenase expression
LRVFIFESDSLLCRTTEEFFVETQNDAGRWEPRILLVNNKFIEEGDTGTGATVIRHEVKQLVDVREVTKEYGNSPTSMAPERVIRLDFRLKASDRTHHTICFFKMETEDETTRLLDLLRDVLEKSTQKIKCVACNAVYNLQELDSCSKCGSTFLIVFEASDGSSQGSSQSFLCV